MSHQSSAVGNLRFEIDTLEARLSHLRTKLAEAESSATPNLLPNSSEPGSCNADTAPDPQPASKQIGEWEWPLDAEEYKRYGRQMIMPEIGLEGWI